LLLLRNDFAKIFLFPRALGDFRSKNSTSCNLEWEKREGEEGEGDQKLCQFNAAAKERRKRREGKRRERNAYRWREREKEKYRREVRERNKGFFNLKRDILIKSLQGRQEKEERGERERERIWRVCFGQERRSLNPQGFKFQKH